MLIFQFYIIKFFIILYQSLMELLLILNIGIHLYSFMLQRLQMIILIDQYNLLFYLLSIIVFNYRIVLMQNLI